MRARERRAFISGMIVVGLLGSAAPVRGATLQPATVRDGIAIRTLAFPIVEEGASPCGLGTDYESVASVSRGGKRFVIVTRRGDLRLGENVYSMLLWRWDARHLLGPRAILRMRTATYEPGIDPATIVWAPNGRSVTFLGAIGRGNEQVYRYQLRTKRLSLLTHSTTSIISYAMDRSGNIIAYGAVGPTRSIWTPRTRRHGLVVARQNLLTITLGKAGEPWALTHSTLYISSHGITRQIRPIAGAHFEYYPGGLYERSVSISPNGRYVIVPETVPNHALPRIWDKYTNLLVRMGMKSYEKFNGNYVFSRLVLVHVRTGRSNILLNVPVMEGISEPLVWSPDSRNVIISNTVLPLVHGRVESPDVLSKEYTIDVNVVSGSIDRVGRQCALALRWTSSGLVCERHVYTLAAMERRSADDRRVAKASGCPVPSDVEFRLRRPGRWRIARQTVAQPLEVSVRQGMNAPPRLYYRTFDGTKKRLLLNLNPQLTRVQLAHERLFTWDWEKGHEITAGLYYPTDYRPGHRYPLVIQTHGFSPNQFAYWGAFPTSDAAQPLAAHGMFVLQVNDSDIEGYVEKNDSLWQLAEAQRALKIYQSAIAVLTRQGLIEPSRVGIIGFSHTCFFVYWALTRDPTLFAAASVTEGDDGSPMEDMLGMWDSVDNRALYGGPPFGSTLKNWVRWSPIFYVNRVRTPLLIFVPHHVGAIYAWEWLEGLRKLHKPVEMVVEDGRIKDLHIMQDPLSIALASGESVDWFDYWLNGKTARGPVTAAEYRGWEKMCVRERRESPKHPVFCSTTGRS